MKKYLRLIFVSLLGVLSILPGTATSAFADSAQSANPSLQRNAAVLLHIHEREGWHPVGHEYYNVPQVKNQYFHGNRNSGNHVTSIGNNLNNTGNSGWNRRYMRDDTSNAGNQIANHREQSRYQINNQYFWGNSNTRNTYVFKGYNQGNSANEGVNDGIIQDNNSNSGNQILN